MRKRCILLTQFTSVYMCLMPLSAAPIILMHSTGRLVSVLDTVFSVRKEQSFVSWIMQMTVTLKSDLLMV